MKSIEINGSLRAETGKKATRELRKNDSVPCVLYGINKDENGNQVATHFTVTNDGLRKFKAGGKLALQVRKLRVKALYNLIPEKLIIDVTSLGLGKTIKVGDLKFEGLQLLNVKEAVVCGVKLTRAARGAQAAAATTKK